MAITFHFQKKIELKSHRRIRSIVTSIFKNENLELFSLDYIFCSDAYLLNINRNFLGHDYYTDIITFDLSPEGFTTITGEIYISVDMVANNARKYHALFSEELCRVMFHGALHLCGYKDKGLNQKKLMRQLENKYLDMFHGEH